MADPTEDPAPALSPGVPDLHPVIGRERDAMEEELLRARELLRDGMAKLHMFFDALRASVSAQAELLEKLSDESVAVDDRRATLHQLFADHERVLSQSESAILGLQLEDVLGQLLEFTRKRAEGMSTLASTLAEVMDHNQLARDADLQQRLRHAVAQVDERAGSRMVEQDSLNQGDVELF